MQRYFSNQLDNNKLILSSDDWYHIKTVMRMNNNDQIEVVYDAEVYLCEIDNQDIKIINKLEKKIDNNKKIILVIPLLRENKMDLVLQKATELGVNTIIPIKTERSIVQIDKDKENKKIIRWTRICKEASEQSHRTDIPIVTEIKNLNSLENIDGLKIVCSTREDKVSLKKILTKHENYDRIIIVIGPEGGLSNDEENYLIKIGFNPVTLGNRIMRVETVPIFLLSVLNYEYME
ncbi:MAG: RsmE family RNA methyltransferase [Bacilli bacterium]|nr:RsmE family RNA methyltransferase [Bacilli bacterium]MDD4607860.1 RsmE family RNA methyltransferase [Bacilli bacterium]